MNFSANLSSVVSSFFLKENKRDIDKASLVRSDGIVVFATSDIKNKAASIGALVGGVWQAAEALSQTLNNDSSMDEYRFSFDKSDCGIYILPIEIGGKDYYFSTLYKETFNPALLKRNFRIVKEDLNNYINKNFKQVKETRKQFLFSNITDEEMDNLFAL